MTANFRIEPEVGFYRYGVDRDGNQSALSNLRLGVGLFQIKSFENSKIHVGGRTGIYHNSLSYKNSQESDDSSKDDFFVGFAVGGEYLFSSHISLGGEAQLNYIKPGDYDDDGPSISLISTRSMIVLRVYF